MSRNFSPDAILDNLSKETTLRGLSIFGITKEFTHYPGNNKLIIVIPPWHCERLWWWILKRQTKKFGYSTLIFDIAENVLCDSPKNVVKRFKEGAKTIAEEINLVTEKEIFQDIFIVGMSIGSVTTILTLREKLPKIKKVVLLAPGDSLAECFWGSARTQKLKKQLEDEAFSFDKLKKAWEKISPIQNLEGLENRRVEIELSEADLNIPYSNGKNLVKKMKSFGLKPKVKINRWLGHYLTILKFFFNPEKYLKD